MNARPPALARSGDPAASRPAEIQGVVDNVAAGRIFGWAWNPSQPEERVLVELRLGQKTVARTRADGQREDLHAAGIGDGRHAFDLPLTPELIERRAEIFVVARTEDGLEVPLPILGARRALGAVPDGGERAPGAALSRSMRALSGAQQALREQMDALACRLPTEAATAALIDLRARVEALEIWCLRIDGRLAALSAAPPTVSSGRRIDGWQVVLGMVALLGVLGGVAVAWIGAFPVTGPR